MFCMFAALKFRDDPGPGYNSPHTATQILKAFSFHNPLSQSVTGRNFLDVQGVFKPFAMGRFKIIIDLGSDDPVHPITHRHVEINVGSPLRVLHQAQKGTIGGIIGGKGG